MHCSVQIVPIWFFILQQKCNEIFGGFVIGKILDSAIIGLLCFIGLTILNMPYTMLVSVIVGVTNVIPFFWAHISERFQVRY